MRKKSELHWWERVGVDGGRGRVNVWRALGLWEWFSYLLE